MVWNVRGVFQFSDEDEHDIDDVGQGANSDGEMDDEEAAEKKKAEIHDEPPPTAQSLVEQERKKKGLLGRKVRFSKH